MGQGGPTLYVYRRTCQAKLQQGVIEAADLKKIVNELRIQHAPNQSTLSQAEIHIIIPGEEPPCETLVSGMDDLDHANLQTHQSLLGKRKVPCELPCTPEINKMPKIVTDPQEGMSRNLAKSINAKSLFKWLDTNKQKLAKQIEVENLLVNK